MEWKAEYDIGIDRIDKQHRQLAEKISRLEAASKDAQNKEMGSALKFLVDYTHYHFSEEESHMQEVGFPACERHKTLHRELSQKLLEILLKLKNEGTIQPQELIGFLTDWLVNHILDEDKKLGLYISGQKDNTTAKDIALQEIAEADIVKKLQKLKALHEKQLISEVDYESKKKSFLTHYSSAEALQDPRTADHKFSFLETLQKDHLITKEDEKEHKAILFKQIDLESFLNQIPEIEKKLVYLKSIYEDHFITEEAYESLKSKLLQDL
jgi:hemerythrin